VVFGVVYFLIRYVSPIGILVVFISTLF